MAGEKKVTEKKRRPTAEKRMIQNEKRRMINKAFKSKTRTTLRKFEECLEKGDPVVIKTTLNEVNSQMDRGVKRGIFKLNKARRTKSRCAAQAHAKMS